MPEGDTIARTARTLRQWLEGREITAARSVRAKVPANRLVGRRVEAVEARAKHLLIRLSSGDVLYTHMRMTGSWHVYSAGEKWRKPGHQARLVLEAGDRVAVCFDAPVVELLAAGEEERHQSLAGLGPDVLNDELDLAEVVRRARARPPDTTAGDVLLDQRVVSGIGNIWRCETLAAEGVHPSTPVDRLGDDDLRRLVTTASRLMKASTAGARPDAAVYGRGGRPCRRCGTGVRVARGGDPVRDVWWCPRCQPEP
ncbi:MAG TPA: DNA-formamidopyrimidine glycosylase family protein [Acidimicrobiales bacterium]|nr:DNA-formamidopyrimidine glycosylase family protein [Acidimicrobiales bacterium]